MTINFSISNQSLDLTYALAESKDWWFNNALPKIPLETNIEDLTNDQKISLVKLAIYENYLNTEHLCNLPNNSFTINS
jgi:hypothetical protein